MCSVQAYVMHVAVNGWDGFMHVPTLPRLCTRLHYAADQTPPLERALDLAPAFQWSVTTST